MWWWWCVLLLLVLRAVHNNTCGDLNRDVVVGLAAFAVQTMTSACFESEACSDGRLCWCAVFLTVIFTVLMVFTILGLIIVIFAFDTPMEVGREAQRAVTVATVLGLAKAMLLL